MSAPAQVAELALAAAHQDEEEERQRKAYRRARRRARERALEIRELNITAMMDMMTILLVFLLKSYTASSSNVSLTAELQLPSSTTQAQPREDITVTVSSKQLLVNERPVAELEGGIIVGLEAGAMLVPSLHAALAREVAKQKYIARYNADAPFQGRVNVIADKRVPYRTLLQVLYTAGEAELGQYRLMALRAD